MYACLGVIHGIPYNAKSPHFDFYLAINVRVRGKRTSSQLDVKATGIYCRY